MSIRRVISLAAVAALGIACVSADAFAARVVARGGAVGIRGGAVGVRGGAVAYRGGLGYRGGLYGGGYYRPGLGLAAGAVVGSAIAASQPADPGYCAYGNGYGCGYGSGYGSNPGYSYASTTGYAGGCTSDPIMCDSQCWLNDNATNYRWGECPAVHVRAH
jgi:hypothetical protein